MWVAVLSLLLGGGAAAAQDAGGLPAPCGALPAVPGLDQGPSSPDEWGMCTDKVEPKILGVSNWYARAPVSARP